jgi:hypothetical protein
MFEEILEFLASPIGIASLLIAAILPTGRKTVRNGVKSAIHAGLKVKDEIHDLYTEVKEEFEGNGHKKLELHTKRIEKPKS